MNIKNEWITEQANYFQTFGLILPNGVGRMERPTACLTLMPTMAPTKAIIIDVITPIITPVWLESPLLTVATAVWNEWTQY